MFGFFFFSLGLVSILSQIAILKELIFNFYGNEFFTGIILAFWLLQTAAGSWFGEKFIRNSFKKHVYPILLALSFFLLPLSILFIRVGFTALFGQLGSPGLFPGLVFIFFCLLPICFLLGFLFPLGVKVYRNGFSFQKNIGGKAYLWETLGLVAGGLLFNYLLINSSFPLPDKLNSQFFQQRFPGLIKTAYSPYGIINVTQNQNQFNFYGNGKLVAVTGQNETAEYKIHLIFSHAPSPRRVLIIGGLNQIPEILKYPTAEQVDYLELDPYILKLSQQYLPADLKPVFKNPKVKLIFSDPRLFLRQASSKYDLIIFNLPNPSTAFVNRLYTQEAFGLVKKNLNFNGIFALGIFSPTDYLSREAADFAGLIKQTLTSVFTFVKILPEENEILFLSADNSDLINQSVGNLSIRFTERKIPTDFFTSDYLDYRLSQPKITMLNSLFQEQSTKNVNSDFRPLAYFQQIAFWQTMKSFTLAKLFNRFNLLPFPLILLLTAIGLIIGWKKLKKPASFNFLLIAFTGFNLMALEILIIYSFQAVLGYVFQKIALIFTFVLGGMAAGNWLFYRLKINKKRLTFYLWLFWPIYYLSFIFLIKIPEAVIFYLLSGSLGLFSGFIFPMLSQKHQKTGQLYAFDLAGSFSGSLTSALFFMPVFGIYRTVLILALINLVVLIIPLRKPGLYK